MQRKNETKKSEANEKIKLYGRNKFRCAINEITNTEYYKRLQKVLEKNI